MNRLPLAGRRIAVTRPRADAENLVALIRRVGGEALCLPAIEIREASDLTEFHAVADRLDAFDIAVFVSRNAVRKAMELLPLRRGDAPWPARLKVAAVGRGTRSELESCGFSAVIAPAAQADSEALLALPELARVARKRIAIFRGEGGRKLLGQTLAARGARVEYAECYRRVRPGVENEPLLAALARGALDAVTVSSGEGLANLFAMLHESRRLREAAFFVPHARVAEQAARLGVRKALVAGPGDEEVVAALVAYFGGAR